MRSKAAAIALLGAVLLGACSGRSDAQKRYLAPDSGSLGACTMGEEGGDFGGPLDPFQPTAWIDSTSRGRAQAWGRVVRWRITSKPKDPPGDMTVGVDAGFEWYRGDRALLSGRIGAHRQLARAVARAHRARMTVLVSALRIRGRAYMVTGIALDDAGRISWLGECSHRASDDMARALDRAGTNQRAVAPAVRRWFSNGNTSELVNALKRASSRGT